jgi:hypothetical protein
MLISQENILSKEIVSEEGLFSIRKIWGALKRGTEIAAVAVDIGGH